MDRMVPFYAIFPQKSTWRATTYAVQQGCADGVISCE